MLFVVSLHFLLQYRPYTASEFKEQADNFTFSCSTKCNCGRMSRNAKASV